MRILKSHDINETKNVLFIHVSDEGEFKTSCKYSILEEFLYCLTDTVCHREIDPEEKDELVLSRNIRKYRNKKLVMNNISDCSTLYAKEIVDKVKQQAEKYHLTCITVQELNESIFI